MRLCLLLSVVAFLIPPISSDCALTPWEKIHQTLHTYPLAIDFRNGPLFAAVFAPNAVANYTGALSNLSGIDAIRNALLASVAGLATQHQLGTIVINIAADAKSASSTTYFTANLASVAPSKPAGQFTVLFGNYRDELVVTDKGWRILRRQLQFMTPNVGNLKLG